jgi:hypothetical protein
MTDAGPQPIGDEEIGVAMNWLIPTFESIRPPGIARFDWTRGQAMFALRELDHYRARARPGESFSVSVPGYNGSLRVRVGPGLVLGYTGDDAEPSFTWTR